MLDKLRAKKRLRTSPNIHLTEFGYQTNPPDKAVGISLASQTKYLQQAAFVAWRAKRVRGLSFYQWDDEPVDQPRQRHQALLGLADGPALQRRQAQAGALDVPGAVRDRAQGQGQDACGCGARCAPTPSRAIVVQVRPRGAADFPDVAPVNDRGRRHLDAPAEARSRARPTATAGRRSRRCWTRRPVPRVSGSVDPSRSEKTAAAGRLGAVTDASEDPAAFYTAGYSLADHDEGMKMGRWRALGARSKAAHARSLCARRGSRPATVVEIGCGDGSLLLELAAVWPAASFDGFELSPPAIEIARGRGIPRVGRLEAYDGVGRARRGRRVRPRGPLARARARARPGAAAGRGRAGGAVRARRGAAGGQPLRLPARQARRGGADRAPARLRPRGGPRARRGRRAARRRRAQRPAAARAPRVLRRDAGGPRGRHGQVGAARGGVANRPDRAEGWFTMHYAVLATRG